MNREKALLRLSSIQFAMWEMRMYLDTHLENIEAQKLYEKYKAQFEKEKTDFEEKFGPITLNSNNSDEWLKDPWPWDNQ